MRKQAAEFTDEMDDAIRARYLDDGPSILAREFGLVAKQVSRRAVKLGVFVPARQQKRKPARRPPPIPTLLELLERQPRAAMQTCEGSQLAPDDPAQCLAAIRQEVGGERFTRGDLGRRLGWSEHTAGKAIKRLLASGHLATVKYNTYQVAA